MTDKWDRVARLLGVETLNFLKTRKIAVIGLGSGGGFVAMGLAMSGVSDFVLIDEDVIEAHNVVRHVASYHDIGRPKVEVVAGLIQKQNPDAHVQAVRGRIEHHQEAIEGVDLVVCAVDGEGAKFFINELCLKKNLKALYAGVYERGEGGDVTVIKPYDGPCYACWASTLREGYVHPSPDGSGELDYGLINAQGTLDAEPGLWLHVVRVAATQADMALNTLIEGMPAYRQLPGNTVILANGEIEVFHGRRTLPYSAEWVTIERNPECLVCGGKHLESAVEALSLDALGSDMISLEDEDEEAYDRRN
ncbi:MAG: ThiF family adenylyltransferase [Anaerolineae bacterium]|nr:ThiF family adenylyltransferase [Anaerolineae bacterium]